MGTINATGETGIVFDDAYPRYRLQWTTESGTSIVDVLAGNANQSELENALIYWANNSAGSALPLSPGQNAMSVTRVNAPTTDSLAVYDNVLMSIDTSGFGESDGNGGFSLNYGDTYFLGVSLTAQPPHSAIIQPFIESVGLSDVSITAGSQLNFSSANWDTPQTVTVQVAESATPGAPTSQIFGINGHYFFTGMPGLPSVSFPVHLVSAPA